MFIKMHDTLINSRYVIRINPIAKAYKDNDEVYTIVMEVQVAGGVEGRQYTYLDRTEAEEVMEKIEEVLL